MPIKNKIALITGGAKGIGFFVAKELLARGLRGCTIADIDQEKGKAAVNEFGKDKAQFVKCDVSNSNQLEEAFHKTIDKYINLDIVVNNAGILDEEDWCKMIDVNLKAAIRGTYLQMRCFNDYPTAADSTVINISSIYGLQSIAHAPIYAAANNGIIGFTRSVGTQQNYETTNVRVLALCPGVTICTDLYKCARKKLISVNKKKLDQPPEAVGQAVSRLLEKYAATGSCWIIEHNKLHNIYFPSINRMTPKEFRN